MQIFHHCKASILIDVQPPGTPRQVRLAFHSLPAAKPAHKAPRSPALIEAQASSLSSQASDTPQSQMCRIETFHVVYPNGFRESREQVVNCRRGTRSQPCRHAHFTRLEDRPASASDLRPLVQPNIVQIEPRDLQSSGLQSRGNERRDPTKGITLKLNFWNPFSSKKRVRKGRKSQPPPKIVPHDPPIPPPPTMSLPQVVQIQPPEVHNPRHHPEREPGRRRRRRNPPIIHHSREEDEDGSSSPPEAHRQHGRRTRSLSPISRYEAEKELIRQRELRERDLRARERRERINREEREAQKRAAILERLEQQRERDEQTERALIQERLERQRERDERRERQERQERQETRRRERLAAEREAIRQQRERNREQARIRQEREDLEHLRAERAWQLREERDRRLQEEEDIARRRETERARQLREERARHQYAEQQRRARAELANIPRDPRHPIAVHGDHRDRGRRFIQSAISRENLRQFERRAGGARGLYDDYALRRRNTIDGGQRWYDRQRGGWR